MPLHMGDPRWRSHTCTHHYFPRLASNQSLHILTFPSNFFKDYPINLYSLLQDYKGKRGMNQCFMYCNSFGFFFRNKPSIMQVYSSFRGQENSTAVNTLFSGHEYPWRNTVVTNINTWCKAAPHNCQPVILKRDPVICTLSFWLDYQWQRKHWWIQFLRLFPYQALIPLNRWLCF